MQDFVVYKSEAAQGRLVELVQNKHCETYEVIVDGIPVFISIPHQSTNDTTTFTLLLIYVALLLILYTL